MTDYTARYKDPTPVVVMITIALTAGYLGCFGMIQDNKEIRSKPSVSAPKQVPREVVPTVKPDPLVAGVIATESGGKQSARSKKGAIGLMQLMPRTAKELGVDPRDAAANVRGGTAYLGHLTARYGSRTLGLVAYNMGPGATDKWLKRGGRWHQLPKETRDYVSKVSVNAALAELASR